ncbi:hypothetical protein ABK040_011499 [Willaertia magna]
MFGASSNYRTSTTIPSSTANANGQQQQTRGGSAFDNTTTNNIEPNNVTFKHTLHFDASFESANLDYAIQLSDYEYELYIRPDTNNLNKKLWFYFKVSNTFKNQKVLFTIANMSKHKSLYRDGMTPLVKSTSRNYWERIPEKQVYYYMKDNIYYLSFVFVFDNENDFYSFAYCYPYTYSDLQKYLFYIENLNLNYFSRSCLCRTIRHLRCDLLSITTPSNNDSKKPIICITSRIHPGETPSSYVCHGVINFLISNHPIAQRLRDNIRFYIVPMLNPDGVFEGNYRCCSMGYDLNRQWINPDEWCHPTIHAVRKLLLELTNHNNCNNEVNNNNTTNTNNMKGNKPITNNPIDFLIDLHAHSNASNGFMYLSDESDVLFPKYLDKIAKEFSLSDTKKDKDPTKLGTSRRVFGELLNIVKYCYTLEVSFYSYINVEKHVPFTIENYYQLGINLCLALDEYYQLQK